jgi:hypothetical protein
VGLEEGHRANAILISAVARLEHNGKWLSTVSSM